LVGTTAIFPGRPVAW